MPSRLTAPLLPPMPPQPQVSQMVSREMERECVVVFDEAHNIDNVCIEALSGGRGRRGTRAVARMCCGHAAAAVDDDGDGSGDAAGGCIVLMHALYVAVGCLCSSIAC